MEPKLSFQIEKQNHHVQVFACSRRLYSSSSPWSCLGLNSRVAVFLDAQLIVDMTCERYVSLTILLNFIRLAFEGSYV